jgi:hypothetical protein
VNWPVTLGVAAVLVLLFSVPLAFLFSMGPGDALVGALFLSPFLGIQYLIFRAFRRWLPKVTIGKPDDGSD